MAYPSIVDDNSDSFGNSTSHTISWGTAPAAGDLLFVFVGYDAYATTTTWGTYGFTEIHQLAVVQTNQEGARLFVRVCDGSEASSDTMTLSASEAISYCTLLVRGWGWWVTKESGNATPPRSPLIISPADSQDILWVVLASCRDTNAWSAAPSGYTLAVNLVNSLGGGTSNVDVAMAAKQAAAASETPAAWGASELGVAITLAIGPSISAGGGIQIARGMNGGMR